MNLEKNKKTYDEKTKNLIKYMFVFTIIILVTLYICGKYIVVLNRIQEFKFSRYIDGANCILALISVPCCFLYYRIYKNEEFFILILSYVSIFIEYIFINLYFKVDNFLYYSMAVPFLFRCLCLFLAMKNKSKLSKIIVKGRYISIIVALLVNIIGLYCEFCLRSMLGISFISKYFPMFNAIIIIFYFVLLTLLFRRCMAKNEFIYMVFIISISIFTLRRLFFQYNYSILFIKSMYYNKILSFLGFLVLLVGLYVEVLRRIEITEKLDTEVKKNKRMIESITENIEDLIFVTDSKGKIIYVSRSVIEKLGFKKEEIIGINYKTIIKDEFIEVKEIIDKSSGENIEFSNYQWKCKRGQVLKTEAIMTSILDESNNILGKVIVARDDNLMKKIDKINRKYNAIIETENLRNQFFANISHEFKTPINIVYSCVQLLDVKRGESASALLESYGKYRKNIKQNCHRMLRLINNLVDITKIDSGYMNLEFSNYNIVELVENIVLSVVPCVDNNNINIIFDTYIEELEIKCDADSIERIILNLLSNAIKFTENNGDILVEMDSDDKWVTIKVRDNGIGIPDKFKDLVFDRFVQGDKSLNRKKEGSGIGLALVKSLIEFHSGSIEINKEYKDGTEFILKLPNIKIEEKDLKINNDIDVDDKKIIEKINIEFSDIYELRN